MAYTSAYSGTQIDDSVGRAMTGGTIESKITELVTRDNELQEDLTAVSNTLTTRMDTADANLQSEINALDTRVTANETDIDNLQARAYFSVNSDGTVMLNFTD